MKTIWRFLKKLKTQWPSDPLISTLNTQPRKVKTYVPTETCTRIFKAALSVIAKRWKTLKSLSMDDWINNLWWCIHGLPSLVAQLVKNLPAMQRLGFDPWVEKIPWRRAWQPTPVLLPAKFHRWRSRVGYSPWDSKDLHTTEQLHFSLHINRKPSELHKRQ